MSLYNNAIFVSAPADIPTCEHWAIIEFTTVTIPGDERSRTAPGHGYPEHQQTEIRYTAFAKHEDFAAEVRTRLKRRENRFRAIHVAASVDLSATYALEEQR